MKKDSLIKIAREKRGWSQLDLCKKTGLSYNTVAFAERGETCSERTAKKIGKILKLRPGPLMTDKKPRKKYTRRISQKKETKDEVAEVVTETAAEAVPSSSGTENGSPVAGVNDPNPAGHSVVGQAQGERGEADAGVQPIVTGA